MSGAKPIASAIASTRVDLPVPLFEREPVARRGHAGQARDERARPEDATVVAPD
jgi:hypothetical protein